MSWEIFAFIPVIISVMKTFFRTYGALAADTAGMILGILFLCMRQISWIIVTILLLLLCLYQPIVDLITTHSGIRTNDSVDIAFNCLAFAVAIPILLSRGKYMYNIFFLAGVWMLAAAFLAAIECYVIARDHQPHFLARLLYTIYAAAVGLFLILGTSFRMREWILSLLAGIFFLTYSLRAFITDCTRFFPDSAIARHSRWSLSLPLIVSAFVPMRAWFRVQQADELPADDAPADLYVYVYCKGSGFERFGHIDIAYHGMIYSYGCHDPENRTLGGTLGDGVLIVIDQKKFIQNASQSENKTVIQYGLKLNEEQKKIVQERINAMMARTIPWKPAYQRLAEAGKDPSGAADYASRIFRNTKASFYKFVSGKFRTYFVASTNCVLLADELIRNDELRLVSLSGFVTPGTYLDFLEREYRRPGSIVISRTVYKS